MNSLHRIIKAVFVLGTIAILASGCTKPQHSLTAAGATFPYPVYAQWFEAYHRETGVKINYQPMGSGAGVEQLRRRTTDFGASDVAVQDDILQSMPRQIIQLPAVAGAVVIAYQLPGLQKPLQLDGPVLADIFLGKVQRWNDTRIAGLNPGVTLPDLAISPVRRSDGSGTTGIFTSYLAAVSPQWKQQVGVGKSVAWPVGIGAKGNSGVAGVIKQSPGALGYIELAYAEHNHLQFAALRNSAGNFVLPSVTATTAAAAGAVDRLQKDIRASIVNASGEQSYPIAAFTYLLVYANLENAQKANELKGFLQWAMSDGQHMAEKLYYAPLPPQVVVLNKKVIQKIQ